MAQTIADRIRDTGGRTNGFDYLRILLAMFVIIRHGTLISYGEAADRAMWSGLGDVLTHSILPLFFALSGFLVAGSLERCPTLISFYGLRLLRIVPALFVEVTLSALIFGPLLSSFDTSAYFSSSQFHSYFLNILGDIHYLLPGVFENNPLPLTVNGQLWTVPFELECYVALGALVAVGIVKRRALLLWLVILGQCLWAWEAYKRLGMDDGAGATGPVLVLSFLAGLLFYLYRDVIVLSKPLFIAALAVSIGLLWLPHGSYLAVIPATYVTVYVGLLNPRKIPYLFAGDYSYGIYLYGYPIQQTFASLGPWAQHWYLNLAVCLPAAFIVAYFSWNFIEKPTLAMRRHLPGIERRLLALAHGAEHKLRATGLGRDGMMAPLLSGGVFIAGVGAAALLVDSHEELGLLSAAICFVLGILRIRYRKSVGTTNIAAATD